MTRPVDSVTGIVVPTEFVGHQFRRADERILFDLSLVLEATTGFHFEGRSLPRNY